MGSCCSSDPFDSNMDISKKIWPDTGALPVNKNQPVFADDEEKLISYISPTVQSALINLDQFYLQPLEDEVTVESREIILLDDGTSYLGEWNPKTNERHGRGIAVFKEKSFYEGQWKLGKQNGNGRLIHANGDFYKGDWLDGKAHGRGIYTHADGAEYVGDWKEDKQDGHGIENWPDGSIYYGSYVDGKKHGKGEYVWADGNRYEGEFSDN